MAAAEQDLDSLRAALQAAELHNSESKTECTVLAHRPPPLPPDPPLSDAIRTVPPSKVKDNGLE